MGQKTFFKKNLYLSIMLQHPLHNDKDLEDPINYNYLALKSPEFCEISVILVNYA